jgi:hypothetical protein
MEEDLFTPNTEVKCFSETSVDFKQIRTRRCRNSRGTYTFSVSLNTKSCLPNTVCVYVRLYVYARAPR